MKNMSRLSFTALTREEVTDRWGESLLCIVWCNAMGEGLLSLIYRAAVRSCVKARSRLVGRAKITVPSHISQWWGIHSPAVWHFSTDRWPAPSGVARPRYLLPASKLNPNQDKLLYNLESSCWSAKVTFSRGNPKLGIFNVLRHVKPRIKVSVRNWNLDSYLSVKTATEHEAIRSVRRPEWRRDTLNLHRLFIQGGFSHQRPNSSLRSGKYSRKDRNLVDLKQTYINKHGPKPSPQLEPWTAPPNWPKTSWDWGIVSSRDQTWQLDFKFSSIATRLFPRLW